MNAQAKVTMLLCSGLEAAEQEKVERLDGPISEVFMQRGQAVRFCQGRIKNSRRLLDFRDPSGVVVSVPAAEFLKADDDQTLRMLAR